MSEHQYYEFQMINRRLSKKEMEELRQLSSRAEITPTSFTNTYNYGDFKGDPQQLMTRYFDVFIYLTNWGVNQLMLRIPKGLIDEKTISAYCTEETLSKIAGDDCIVLDFESNEEEAYELPDDDRWMPELSPLRAEILRGDLRSLYLGWLSSLYLSDSDGEDEDDAERAVLEPPVPPGLGDLTDSLKSLAEFLRIDNSLLEAAAKGSVGKAPAKPSTAVTADWVKSLPEAEKDAYLLQLLDDENESRVRTELLQRFQQATAPRRSSAAADRKRRTVADLFKAAKTIRDEKARIEAERLAEDKASKARKKAEKQAERRKHLATQEPQAWNDVERRIEGKNAHEYDLAVALLEDLLDLADSTGRRDEALSRIRDVRKRHARKSTLAQKLDRTFRLK